MSSDRVGIFTQ